jgi:hypothetical protein
MKFRKRERKVEVGLKVEDEATIAAQPLRIQFSRGAATFVTCHKLGSTSVEIFT